jgi:pSer/pThr/pTyr-binding forkhead associated (FHA) protein
MPRITITVPEKTPQPYRFQLDRTTVTLGRGSENDIAIDSRSVSVKHAEMVRVEGGYELRDMGSTNGIKLDAERQEVIQLKNGLSVALGDVGFDFLLNDEELEILHREKPESAVDEEPPGDLDEPSQTDDDDPKPKKKIRPKAAAQDGGDGSGSDGSGCAMILLFLILAAAALFAGMAVRYQKDTGSSLIDAIRNRGKVLVPAANEKPAPASAVSQ